MSDNNNSKASNGIPSSRDSARQLKQERRRKKKILRKRERIIASGQPDPEGIRITDFSMYM